MFSDIAEFPDDVINHIFKFVDVHPVAEILDTAMWLPVLGVNKFGEPDRDDGILLFSNEKILKFIRSAKRQRIFRHHTSKLLYFKTLKQKIDFFDYKQDDDESEEREAHRLNLPFTRKKELESFPRYFFYRLSKGDKM
jgi:hypothetical protein